MKLTLRQWISITFVLLFVLSSFGFTISPVQADGSGSPGDGPTVTVAPGIPIVIDAGESAPIHRAVTDLQRDLYSVFGVTSSVYNDLNAVSGQTAIVIIGPDSDFTTGQSRWVSGTEAHRVFVESTPSRNYIVLQGADMRGAIYAIYTFSEKVLDIPPLWFWASWTIAAKSSIDIPLTTDYVFQSPTVQYRAWFPNDQSRYSKWQTAVGDNDRSWAEALLRLKLNTIVMDSVLVKQTYAEWVPTLPESGQYNVQIWKVVHSQSDPNAKIQVVHRDGMETAYVDYTAGPAGWVDLGTYDFDAGTYGYVRNYKNTFTSTSNMRVNAVKFTRVGGGTPSELIILPGDAGYSESGSFGNSSVKGYNDTATRLSSTTVPGTQLTGDAQAAKQYGIVVASTHISTFGTLVPESPTTKLATIDAQFARWSEAIDAIRSHQLETVWTITFRGSRDIPFWETYSDAPASDGDRAAVIEEMLDRQLTLLKNKYGAEPFQARTTLYNEVSDFYAGGLLDLPNDPNLIYNFVSARRDHFPPDGIRDMDFGNHPIGYYTNFQFTSTGSHFAQAEGPWKMEQNYRMIQQVSTRPLVFAEGNMGNIREHLLEGSAFARMMWDWNGYDTDSYVAEFTRQYFGIGSGGQVAELYKDFIESYWEQRNPTIPGFDRQYILQDLSYLKIIQDLFNNASESRFDNESWYRIVPADNGASGAFAAMKNGTSAAIAKLQQVTADADALYGLLPAQGKPFFNDLIRTQASFMLGLNETLYHVVRYREYAAQQQTRQAYDELLAAKLGFDRALAALNEQDHGSFRTWNSGITADSLHNQLLQAAQTGLATKINELADILFNTAIIILPTDPGYSEAGSFGNSSVKGYNNSATRLAGDSNIAPPVYAQWTPTILDPGMYKVSIWKVLHSTSDPNAKIEVKHRDGIATSYLNYTQGAAGWVELGTFPFEAGTGGYVRNNKNTFSAGAPTRANAVKFDRVGDLTPRSVTAEVYSPAAIGLNGWYRTPVTITLSPAAIAQYDLQVITAVTASVYGSAYSSTPATGGFVTYPGPIVLTDGQYELRYRSTDTGAVAQALLLNIDSSAPVIEFHAVGAQMTPSGPAYTAAQTVLITCSAVDPLSGMASSSCGAPLQNGPAASLGVGVHTVTASAADQAGLMRTSSFTFRIVELES